MTDAEFRARLAGYQARTERALDRVLTLPVA